MNIVAHPSNSSRRPSSDAPCVKIVERGGIRWHVMTMGSGPGLLILHGTGASSHSFRELMPILADRFTVVAPNLPGHGSSTAPRLFSPSLPATSAALGGLLEGIGLEPVLAVGHSAGAALIVRMTLDGVIRPRLLVGLGAALVPFRGVARVVFPRTAKLLALASRVVDLRLRDRSSIERLLKSTGSSLDSQGVEDYRRLSERPGHVAAVLAMMAHWDLEPLFQDLPSLSVPLFLLAGSSDRAVPLAQQQEAVGRTPAARLRIVSGAGHLLHEEQPKKVAQLIFEEWASLGADVRGWKINRTPGHCQSVDVQGGDAKAHE